MKKRWLYVLSLFLVPAGVKAQGAVCSESKIREAAAKRSYSETEDAFFWSGAYEKPLIGRAEGDEADKKRETEAPRKNEIVKEHPDRIEVSKKGDLAYEYGHGELSFDDPKAGKHIAFQNAYLRVWKAVGGACRVAATMARPLDS